MKRRNADENRGKHGKRRLLYLAVLAMVLTGLFGGSAQAASAKQTYQKGADYYIAGQYKKAKQTFKKLPKKANEACVKKMSAKMKKAYLKAVKKYNTKMSITSKKPYMWGYYLTDIDKDKKPELLVQYGTCEADVRMDIYTYKGGKLTKVDTAFCGHSGFYYDPRGNGMTVVQAHMFYESIYTMKLENGAIQSDLWGSGHSVTATKDYITMPYELDDHVSYDANYNRKIDYSPLR